MTMTAETQLMPQLEQFQKLAKVRSDVYRFCLDVMEKPSRAQHGWLHSKAFHTVLQALCDQFEVQVPDDLELPSDYEDYESTYIACFDVGLPTPPVPLLSSHYNKREPVPATIHEHVLFYKRFGSMLAVGNIEPADHLTNELAFLIRLDELSNVGKIDPPSLHQARLDFLKRHSHRWLPQALQVAREKELPALFIVILSLLTCAIAEDVELTQTLLNSHHEQDSRV